MATAPLKILSIKWKQKAEIFWTNSVRFREIPLLIFNNKDLPLTKETNDSVIRITLHLYISSKSKVKISENHNP